MKKFLVLALSAAMQVAALAAQDTVVLKDTRMYDTYVASVGGLDGCTMPANADAPKAGDCEVKKARYIRGGELLTLSKGLCTRTAWRQVDRTPLSVQGLDMSAPTLEERSEVYKCQGDGSPAKE